MIWSTVLIAVFAQLCISKPLSKRWNDFSLKHSWNEVPRGWQHHGPAPPEYTMDLRIGLRQDKLDELISSLYEVSDPAHARYTIYVATLSPFVNLNRQVWRALVC
jgi:tripeptidyl-peptidase-1